ncbi:MAG: alpha/beta hydrolase [Victivallaceae bacterium]|nr:alpha/beta hydrolase [Victivallaceae bacterium]
MNKSVFVAMMLSILAGGCCSGKINLNELPDAKGTVTWHGYRRHDFVFEGRKAFIVEPKCPAGDGRWSWCAIWPEAFVERVGITELLNHGYYHAHIDVLSTAASPAGVETMKHFHDYLVSLGLARKTNLIGMSWGGFFSLRYAETHPEDIAAIYLDAPVCNAADPEPVAKSRCDTMSKEFKMSHEDFKTSPLNPINNLAPIVRHGIPVMALTGEDDAVVRVSSNIDIVAKRFGELGGKIEIIRRPMWGHHPHGMDDVNGIVRFHQSVHEKQ